MTLQYRSKYGSYQVILQKNSYSNGRLAIQLIDAEDGEPVAIATVNLPEHELAPDEVFIKDWSENDGMVEFLVENGIVEYTGRRVPTGYTSAAVCRLLKGI
jgi:hypothetical protein